MLFHYNILLSITIQCIVREYHCKGIPKTAYFHPKKHFLSVNFWRFYWIILFYYGLSNTFSLLMIYTIVTTVYRNECELFIQFNPIYFLKIIPEIITECMFNRRNCYCSVLWLNFIPCAEILNFMLVTSLHFLSSVYF